MKTEIRRTRQKDALFPPWVMQEAARSHLEIGVWDVLFPVPEAARLDVLSRLARSERTHYAHYTRFLLAQVDEYRSAAFEATFGTPGNARIQRDL